MQTRDENIYSEEMEKLRSELEQLRRENEILKTANAQTDCIRRDSLKQSFYIGQVLKSAPYLLILTDSRMQTVMTSDVYFQYEKSYSNEQLRNGLPISLVMKNILSPEQLHQLISECSKVLEGQAAEPYLIRACCGERKIDWQIVIRPMVRNGTVVGLHILFVEMTEIIDALEQARTANKAKSNFLANMSHEIRTPMNAVMGMSEFILRDSSDPKAKRYASMIRSSSKTLLSIINDILDFSKIESGKMEIVNAYYKLSSLINDVATLIEIRIHDKPVKLVLDLDPDIPDEQYGDEVRIKQIMVNLLGNSVKFTRNGSITVSLRMEKHDEKYNKLICRVTDTGIGMRKDEIEHIFDNFTQIDTTRDRSLEGTGLGLPITKLLINMMGGEISFESVYGKGTTVNCYILTSSRDPTPIGGVKQIRGGTLSSDVYKATFTAKKAKILIVDDNDLNIQVACGALEPYKAEIDCVTSGAEAMLQFSRERYDLIFMDHMMPVMDGVETASMIRKMPFGETVPIVALTANALNGAAQEYKRLGFQDFLSKPIEPYKLEQILLRNLPRELIDGDVAVEPQELTVEPQQRQQTVEDACTSDEAEIDTKMGLRYCMGNIDFYRKMLKVFGTGNLFSEIDELYSNGDWSNYQIKVHGLKSSALTIGAFYLSERAREVEHAAKIGNIGFVTMHHNDLRRIYNGVIGKISNGDVSV